MSRVYDALQQCVPGNGNPGRLDQNGAEALFSNESEREKPAAEHEGLKTRIMGIGQAVVTAAKPHSAMRDTTGSMSRATILARTDLGRSRAMERVRRMGYLFEGVRCGSTGVRLRRSGRWR